MGEVVARSRGPPPTIGLQSRKQGQPSAPDQTRPSTRGICAPWCGVPGLEQPRAHCLRGAPSALTRLTKVVSIANCAPWKRGKPSATTSKRRSSNWPPGKRSKSWTLMLVDTLAPTSLQMREAQLSKGNPRRPSTPEVAHVARWWPRESSGWPHRQKADERERARDTGDVGEQWNGIPAMGPCCERASACSEGPNLGHTALWKKVPSVVEEAKDCHPVREILGNSWNPSRCPRATSLHSGRQHQLQSDLCTHWLSPSITHPHLWRARG